MRGNFKHKQLTKLIVSKVPKNLKFLSYNYRATNTFLKHLCYSSTFQISNSRNIETFLTFHINPWLHRFSTGNYKKINNAKIFNPNSKEYLVSIRNCKVKSLRTLHILELKIIINALWNWGRKKKNQWLSNEKEVGKCDCFNISCPSGIVSLLPRPVTPSWWLGWQAGRQGVGGAVQETLTKKLNSLIQKTIWV